MRKGPQTARRATRREALKAGVAALFPIILPSGVLAQPGLPGANDRVVTGHIGAGIRGQSLLASFSQDAAAVCDVYDPHLRRGASFAGAGVRIYRDYRELLDQRDIDAVVIASPDHWHALHALHAVEAGKDVWLDIPLTRHIGELPLLRDTANQYGCILAPGASVNLSEIPVMVPALRDEITEVECWASADAPIPSQVETVPPDGLDWDAWIGPAPWSPYHDGMVDGIWKQDPDWGGGKLRRDGVQLIAVILHTLGVADLGVVHVDADTAAGARAVTWKFSPPNLTVRWRQPGPEGAGPCGLRLGANAAQQSWKRAEDALWPGADRSDTSVVERARDQWKAAIRERQPLDARVNAVANATLLAHLGNLAARLGRSLEFDTKAMAFKGDTAADRWLRRPGRGAYHW